MRMNKLKVIPAINKPTQLKRLHMNWNQVKAPKALTALDPSWHLLPNESKDQSLKLPLLRALKRKRISFTLSINRINTPKEKMS